MHVAHKSPLQLAETEQSASVVQNAHVPFVQMVFAQSSLAPQALPIGHAGAHAGGAHVPFAHTPEAQSVAPLQALPSGHVGAHAGAAHAPPEHTPDPQVLPHVPQLFASVCVFAH
jgi:hypothetical protein